MYIVNLSEPYTIIGALMITLLFIIFGKEFKKTYLPAIPLFVFLALLMIHTFQSTILTDSMYKAMVTVSMSVDACMIFLSYISYLWVDDIVTREKHKKSIDNSLDWFWKKV